MVEEVEVPGKIIMVIVAIKVTEEEEKVVNVVSTVEEVEEEAEEMLLIKTTEIQKHSELSQHKISNSTMKIKKTVLKIVEEEVAEAAEVEEVVVEETEEVSQRISQKEMNGLK